MSRSWTTTFAANHARLKVFRILLLFATVAVAGYSSPKTNRAFAGDTQTHLQPMLEELRAADSVVLMIVPYSVEFPVALDKRTLQKVACQYAIDEKAVLDDVVKVLRENITEVEPNPRPKLEYRIGIVFRANGEALREFYFNDSGGSFNLVGVSRDYAIKALKGLPASLRALAGRSGTVLVQDYLSRCPHA